MSLCCSLAHRIAARRTREYAFGGGRGHFAVCEPTPLVIGTYAVDRPRPGQLTFLAAGPCGMCPQNRRDHPDRGGPSSSSLLLSSSSSSFARSNTEYPMGHWHPALDTFTERGNVHVMSKYATNSNQYCVHLSLDKWPITRNDGVHLFVMMPGTSCPQENCAW